MAANDIRNFEIKSYGQVILECENADRNDGYGWKNVKHEYHSVPVSVIKKLVNSSKAPSINDFEKWIKEAKGKKDMESKPCDCSFWSSED